jgi:ribulose-phosphate 3-epimerase
MVKIAPSILNANFAHLQRDVDKVQNADILHIDIMDGHFVPNLSMGPGHVLAIQTKLPKEAHLMMEQPSRYAKSFLDAGAKRLIAHAEAEDLSKFIRTVHSNNGIAGVAINPNIPFSKLMPYLKRADFFLLMTVKAGFGGQSFMRSVLPKIRKLRKLTYADIEVDGGVNLETAKLAVRAGATILVAGTSLFNSNDPKHQVEELRSISNREIHLSVTEV